jgi:hypothetical protein
MAETREEAMPNAMRTAPIIQTAAAIIIGLLGSTTMIQAQDQAKIKKYGSAAGWTIYARQDLGPGCLIAKTAPNGMQVQMGIDETAGKRGYMAIYTKANAQIAPGEKFSVIFDVDGQKFTAEPTGQQMGEFVGATTWVNNPNFIYDLAKKKTLTVMRNGREPFTLSLAGTDAAMKALRACQDAN